MTLGGMVKSTTMARSEIFVASQYADIYRQNPRSLPDWDKLGRQSVTYKLGNIFYQFPGYLFTYQMLTREVWDTSDMSQDRTSLFQQVPILRRLFKDKNFDSNIYNVSGVGYTLLPKDITNPMVRVKRLDLGAKNVRQWPEDNLSFGEILGTFTYGKDVSLLGLNKFQENLIMLAQPDQVLMSADLISKRQELMSKVDVTSSDSVRVDISDINRHLDLVGSRYIFFNLRGVGYRLEKVGEHLNQV